MHLEDFKSSFETLFNLKALNFDYYKGDEGGQWYAVRINDGLLEVYIASDGEIGINLPSDNEEISFGGCNEAYSDLRQALDRVEKILM